MSAFDYVGTAAEADSLLREFGALAACTRRTEAPYDPSQGQGGEEPVSSTVTAFAVIFDYSANAYGNQPDALIRAGDRQVYMSALTSEGLPITPADLPIEAALIGPDGDRYVVKNCKPTNPAGPPVLYEIQARRP